MLATSTRPATKQSGVFSLVVIVAALGYFVDIYDLLLFTIVREPSLEGIGINKADAAAMIRPAHTLKSSSATLGARTLAACCHELEALARSGDLGQGAEHARQIEGAYRQAADELQAIREEMGSLVPVVSSQ